MDVAWVRAWTGEPHLSRSIRARASLRGQVSDAFMARLQTQVRIAYAKELRGYAFAFLTITQRDQRSQPSSQTSSRPQSPKPEAAMESAGGSVLQPMTDSEWQALGLSGSGHSSPALSPTGSPRPMSPHLLPAQFPPLGTRKKPPVASREANLRASLRHSAPLLSPEPDRREGDPMNRTHSAPGEPPLSKPKPKPKPKRGLVHSLLRQALHQSHLLDSLDKMDATPAHQAFIRAECTPRSSGPQATSHLGLSQAGLDLFQGRGEGGSVAAMAKKGGYIPVQPDDSFGEPTARPIARSPTPPTAHLDEVDTPTQKAFLQRHDERPTHAEDDNTPTLSVEDWRRLVREFDHDIGRADCDLFANVTFFFRDGDASGDIDLSEFLALAELLKFEIVGESNTNFVPHDTSSWVLVLVDTHWFTSFSIITNIGTVLALAMAANDNSPHHPYVAALLSLAGCFTLEIAMRAVARGTEAFWQSWFNRFDCVVWLLALLTIPVGCSLGTETRLPSDQHWICWGCQWKWLGVLILRVFGLMRLSLWDTQFSVLWWLDQACLYFHHPEGEPLPPLRNHVMAFNHRLMEASARTVSLFFYTGSLCGIVLYLAWITLTGGGHTRC